jgi:hypothetical protein
MDTPAESPKGQPPRQLEFEDPHFHDDVDFEPASEDKDQGRTRAKKPARKLPPPRRRFED